MHASGWGEGAGACGGGGEGGGEGNGTRLPNSSSSSGGRGSSLGEPPAPAEGLLLLLFQSLQEPLALVQLPPLPLKVNQQLLKERTILTLESDTKRWYIHLNYQCIPLITVHPSHQDTFLIRTPFLSGHPHPSHQDTPLIRPRHSPEVRVSRVLSATCFPNSQSLQTHAVRRRWSNGMTSGAEGVACSLPRPHHAPLSPPPPGAVWRRRRGGSWRRTQGCGSPQTPCDERCVETTWDW